MNQLKIFSICLLSMICFFQINGQNLVDPTPSRDRIDTSETNDKLIQNSLVYHLSADNIGPTIMSGRVVDIDVNPEQPTEFLVAYASGGLWHTVNNGTTFEPIFDNEMVMTIGDIAVHWPSKTIYVGTGEVNSSRSSYAGCGMYKSQDMGKTWQWKGLPESHHIGRILVNSKNENKVLVAVLGHLYSPNVERGFYLSEDGGDSWQQTLYIDENSGGIDLISDWDDEDVVYGATWQRQRRAWNFEESGPGSNIYKSINGGKTWQIISNPESGFPSGDSKGRIGLTLSKKGDTKFLYAIIDNCGRRPTNKEEQAKIGLKKEAFKTMSKVEFLKLKEEDLQSFLEDNDFDKKYNVSKVKSMVEKEEILPSALFEYLQDANSLLFDTEVVGAEIYVSSDEGITWRKTHSGFFDGLHYSYGYYFGQIRTSKNNPDVVYVMGVPILRSEDGGVSWSSLDGENMHGDHHALWIDENLPSHLVNGNDGGINISYDSGKNWIKCNNPAVGQFYSINASSGKAYDVYGGLQDNGVWMGSSNTKENVRWQQTGEYPFKSILGGDGMQVQIDTRDNATVYTGFQFGNYYRIQNNKRDYITPKQKLGQHPYRWNWQSPILLSPHNQDILYMGSNKLLRSMDKGDNFIEISEDLTKGGRVGDVPYGTLTSISESSLHFGLIYVGSDDGLVHVTKDGGHTWEQIAQSLPQDLWVSRVQASKFKEGTVYLTLNGYRWDDFTPYVYKSTDYGETWQNISANLPTAPINVIKEDTEDPDILYVGSDHGAYVSIDGGMSYMRLSQALPNVAVHDLFIQEDTHELLLATHGRSIYKLNGNAIVETKKHASDTIFISKIETINYSTNWGKKANIYSKPSEKNIDIMVFTKIPGQYLLEIKTEDNKLLHSEKINLPLGSSNISYKMQVDDGFAHVLEKQLLKSKTNYKKGENNQYYLVPGKYQIHLSMGKILAKQFIEIIEK